MAVRFVAVAVPIVASVVCGVVLSRVIDRPATILPEIGWWVAIFAISTTVLAAVDRVARRLLPLATLLKLSMAFPDQAPSRMTVAARAGTTRKLRDKLEEAQHAGANDEPAQAAARILSLVGALGAHDRRTRGHCERVRAFNDLIADELHLPEHDRDRLRWAALLHDIGKLHVPARILNKPKKPTEKEWEILKSHPHRGAQITAPLADWLGPWAPTIAHHHERWDGTGYPKGLQGTDISLGARIVAVADAFEVMTAPRPYSRPVGAVAARAELAQCAGSQFDPEVVRAFINVSIGKLHRVMGPISWLAQLPFIGSAPRFEAVIGQAGRQAATTAATATGSGLIAVSVMPHAAHAHSHHGTAESPTPRSQLVAAGHHIRPLSTGASTGSKGHAGHAGAPGGPTAPSGGSSTRPAGRHHHQAAHAPAPATAPGNPSTGSSNPVPVSLHAPSTSITSPSGHTGHQGTPAPTNSPHAGPPANPPSPTSSPQPTKAPDSPQPPPSSKPTHPPKPPHPAKHPHPTHPAPPPTKPTHPPKPPKPSEPPKPPKPPKPTDPPKPPKPPKPSEPPKPPKPPKPSDPPNPPDPKSSQPAPPTPPSHPGHGNGNGNGND
jgi:putative nucleotidyltransferase with HDIG domain